MPKKSKKGKNKKSSGTVKKRQLEIAEPGQEYAVCEKVLGNRRFTIKFHDGKKRLGILAGRVKKRSTTWVAAGTWVLCSIRSYQEDKCDIFDVYAKDEVQALSRMGEIDLDLARGIGGNPAEVEDDNVIFKEASDDECAFDIDEI